MKVSPHTERTFKLESASRRVSEYVRFSVKPASHRRWDVHTSAWIVDMSHLAAVVAIGESTGTFVDYSAFDERMQLEIAQCKKAVALVAKETDPYAVMHLLPNAPLAIVEAAFKVLAKTHHPDRGGDASRFREVVEAYERIKQSVE